MDTLQRLAPSIRDLDPEGRMIAALLAATDPLGHIEGGHTADVYAHTAATVLRELQTGSGARDLLPIFVRAGERVEAVDAFIRAVLTWWVKDAPRRRGESAA